jgi:hypothetical protein
MAEAAMPESDALLPRRARTAVLSTHVLNQRKRHCDETSERVKTVREHIDGLRTQEQSASR